MPDNFQRISMGYLSPACDIYITDDQGNLVCVEQFLGQWLVSVRIN